MIKIKELRIDNIVKFKNRDDFYAQITGIDKSGGVHIVRYHKNGLIDDQPEVIEDITGIVLTNEIIKKIGFEFKSTLAPGIDYVDSWILDGYEFGQDCYGEWYLCGYDWNIKRFKYLHNLQNIFYALSGEELDVNKLLISEEQQFFNEIMDECAEEERKYSKEVNRINKRILKAIKSVKGKKFIKGLKKCIKDIEPSDKWEIVRKTGGNFQKEYYGEIKGMWIEQWGVGDGGDSFVGNVYVELKENRWLRMGYSC